MALTPSIIRRFAKYHGVNLCLRVPFTWISSLASVMQVRGTVESDQETRDRVVAALTRIEDAEDLLESAAVHKRLADEDAESAAGYDGAYIAERGHAFDMLRAAGVDPELWTKVKE